jgi:hypothetical protein
MKTFTKQIKSRVLFSAIILSLFTLQSMAQSVSIVGPTNNCTGTTATLSANIVGLQAPYQYKWSTGETTATITISSSATIRVKVKGTNSSGQIQKVVSSPVSFSFTPLIVTITTNGTTNLCPGGQVKLKAHGGTGNSDYLWSNGETTKKITVTQSGNYAVMITEPSGCFGNSSETVVTVYDPSYKPVITPDGPVTFCKPGSVNLSGDAIFNAYTWSTGETSSSINVTLDGSQAGAVLDTLSVVLGVELNNSCSFTSDPLVIRSIRETQLIDEFCGNLNLALSDSIKNGLILSYNGVDPDYEFQFRETTNHSNRFSHVATQTRWLSLADVPELEVGKTYDVRTRGIISGVPYCFGDPCQIAITSLLAGGGNTRVIIDADGEKITVRDGNNFTVSPNPSNSDFTLTISSPDGNAAIVKVSDVAGRTVATYPVNASQSQLRFGSDLNPGVYFAEFNNGSSLKQTIRLVKTNN